MIKPKRALFWLVTVIPACVLACVVVMFAAMYEATKRGPYTRRFNQRLRARADEARLIGAPVARVREVLGPPDSIRGSFEIGPDGAPTVPMVPISTYEYYPYPWVPLAKFRVHTSGDVVRSVEMFGEDAR
jgi:hypothetical protein